MKTTNLSRGYLVLHTLVFAAIGLLILGAIIGWGTVSHRSAVQFKNREQAFQIAEAGIEYYRWHLAHAPQDFKDGTTTPGPYVHNYFDQNNTKIGTFTLTITAPPIGSTVVTLVSKGQVVADSAISRSIEIKLALPSLARFAVVANTDLRFNQTAEVFGPVHANGGVRFDGIAHNLVTSARADYDDPDHSGPNEFGVHTHVTPPPGSGINDNFRPAEAPPGAVPSRPDVFMAGRQFPVPAVDFNGMTADLAAMKTAAQSGGRYIASSGDQGYDIILKTNDTFDLYTVNAIFTPQGNSCFNAQSQTNWSTWTTKKKTLVGNYPFPANGLIFVEDNVWVEGQISSARLTIAAARFPENSSTNANIIVNQSVRYTNYDGQDVLGLVAQGDVNVGLVSDDLLRIDAALVAKNGRVGRYYYDGKYCNNGSEPTSITTFGMIATNGNYGFAYTDGTGYQHQYLNYDSHLLYNPPPFFPLTADDYQILSWREL